MTQSQPLVRVGRVPFGKGVFAAKSIPAGTQLGVVRGRVIDDPDYASSYCIDLGNNLSLEPRAPFRYLNHSCEPNSELHHVEFETDDGSIVPAQIEVHTLRPLAEGEEVTIDYGWSAEAAIQCLCGARRCRGWVVAVEELHKLHVPEATKPTRKAAAAGKSSRSKSGTPQKAAVAAGSAKGKSRAESGGQSPRTPRRPR